MEVFKDLYETDEEDAYNTILNACKEALAEIDDPELEGSESDPEDVTEFCLPEFSVLKDILSGNFDDFDTEKLKKCLCLESVACLGVEAMGPLPIFPNLTDLTVIDDMDMSEWNDDVSAIFEHLENYFAEQHGSRLRPRDLMELHATRFLGAAQA